MTQHSNSSKHMFNSGENSYEMPVHFLKSNVFVETNHFLRIILTIFTKLLKCSTDQFENNLIKCSYIETWK
jgi:hypothetical protein